MRLGCSLDPVKSMCFFQNSLGDDLLVDVQDSKGKHFGCVLVQVATIADNPADKVRWWPIYREPDHELVGMIQLNIIYSTSADENSHFKTIFLPVVGLVDRDLDKLKPSDLVGVNKDSYLILDTLPSEYDSRVKAMEVDEKPTEDYNDIGICVSKAKHGSTGSGSTVIDNQPTKPESDSNSLNVGPGRNFRNFRFNTVSLIQAMGAAFS